MSKSPCRSSLLLSNSDSLNADQTFKNLVSTTKKLINLNEKFSSYHKKRPPSQRSKTILKYDKNSKEFFSIRKTSSATHLARLMSFRNENNEKNHIPKEKIKENVKFALYGIKNPSQCKSLGKLLKRGTSLGAEKVLLIGKKPDELLKQWNEERKKEEKIIKVGKKDDNYEKSISSSSFVSSDFSQAKRETANQEKENFMNSNLSEISRRSSVLDKFGSVSSFITKIFSKDSIKSALLKKNNYNTGVFSQNDCIFYKMMRLKQKEVIRKEIDIICEDQTRLNLSKSLLEKWNRVKYKMKFAIKVNKFNSDIKIFGSSVNVGTEIFPLKSFVGNNLIARQETFLDKISDDKLKNPKLLKKNIIYQDSSFMTYWSFMVIFLLLYTASITPFRVTFIDNTDTEWSVIDYLIDVLFLIDIIVTLNLAYNDSNGKLIDSRLEVFLNYLKSWLFIDIIGIFPFQFFLDESTNDSSNDVSGYNDFMKMLRLPRLYRLMKLTRLYKVMNRREGINIMRKIQNFFKLNSSLVKVLKFLFMVIVFVHLMGCLWHFEAKLQLYGPKTWVYE